MHPPFLRDRPDQTCRSVGAGPPEGPPNTAAPSRPCGIGALTKSLGEKDRVAEREGLVGPLQHDETELGDAHQARVGQEGIARRHCKSHRAGVSRGRVRSEEHTSELQSPCNLVCRLLLEKKNRKQTPPPLPRWCR